MGEVSAQENLGTLSPVREPRSRFPALRPRAESTKSGAEGGEGRGEVRKEKVGQTEVEP